MKDASASAMGTPGESQERGLIGSTFDPHTEDEMKSKSTLVITAVLVTTIVVLGLALDCWTRPTVVALNEQLREAVALGDLSAVRILIGKGANVNASNEMGVTPLMDAALRGRTEIAEMLLENGARTDSIDILGMTALLGAVAQGNQNGNRPPRSPRHGE